MTEIFHVNLLLAEQTQSNKLFFKIIESFVQWGDIQKLINHSTAELLGKITSRFQFASGKILPFTLTLKLGCL